MFGLKRELASSLISRAIDENKTEIDKFIQKLPGYTFDFFKSFFMINRYDSSPRYNYPINVSSQSFFYLDWENFLYFTLFQKIPSIKDLFEFLIGIDLCYISQSYVSTRGGELRSKYYVISQEVWEDLQSKNINFLDPACGTMAFPCVLMELVHDKLSSE